MKKVNEKRKKSKEILQRLIEISQQKGYEHIEKRKKERKEKGIIWKPKLKLLIKKQFSINNVKKQTLILKYALQILDRQYLLRQNYMQYHPQIQAHLQVLLLPIAYLDEQLPQSSLIMALTNQESPLYFQLLHRKQKLHFSDDHQCLLIQLSVFITVIFLLTFSLKFLYQIALHILVAYIISLTLQTYSFSLSFLPHSTIIYSLWQKKFHQNVLK
ncbi:unnamed protein product [Paramecium sonneborni]|uniref:Transmembrane protein n=1 Tax=Paramecium sonneborni TaxID=65129 RepID=A0A8S1NJQ9_9CILI|nr:unnamed protein product [Paramecium sonneborni]